MGSSAAGSRRCSRVSAVRERLAVEKFAHHVARAVGQRAKVEDLEDVVVADASRRLRFTLEARHGRFVSGHAAKQDLERDPLADDHVLGEVHGAHAALPEQLDDPVLPVDDLPSFDAHRRSSTP